MIASAYLWISIAGFLLACFAAIAARALHSFSRSELEQLCQSRQTPDRFGDIIRCHERVALGVEMLVPILAALGIVAGALWTWQSFATADASPWTTFIVAVVLLGQIAAVSTVWLPWSISRIGSSRFLYATWPVWNIVGKLVGPLVWAAGVFDTVLHRVSGTSPDEPDEDSIEEEIRTIVTEGHREGLLEEDAREMIESVIELGDAMVSHIMTPRTDIHMIQADTPWEDVVESVIDSGHTRVPVYGNSKDDIVGILYSKDLLPELAKPADQPPRALAELLRKPLFVPETKPVDALLSFFQKSRTHVAVVMDEFGGVSGLVTIEDALEEIVGEIDDEYDQKSEAIRKIDDDTCEALGKVHVDEINAAMGFDLPENEDFDTIGGFVFAEFGHVPAVNESLTWQDSIRVTVLEVSRRRVNRVRLERVRKESLEAVQLMPIANPIEVYRAESNLEAELLCTYLQNNGIEAHATWDESRAATWMFGNLPQFHGPQVWVDQTNAAAARPLLGEYEREQKLRREKNAAQAWQAGSIEVPCEECGKTTSFAASKKGTTQDCSHCGAYVDVGDDETFDWQSDS